MVGKKVMQGDNNGVRVHVCVINFNDKHFVLSFQFKCILNYYQRRIIATY